MGDYAIRSPLGLDLLLYMMEDIMETIKIIVEGGVVLNVENIPPEIQVKVLDLDIEHTDIYDSSGLVESHERIVDKNDETIQTSPTPA